MAHVMVLDRKPPCRDKKNEGVKMKLDRHVFCFSNLLADLYRTASDDLKSDRLTYEYSNEEIHAVVYRKGKEFYTFSFPLATSESTNFMSSKVLLSMIVDHMPCVVETKGVVLDNFHRLVLTSLVDRDLITILEG